MKKILILFLVIPFVFACEKDDEDTDPVVNVTVQNPSEVRTQEEFRIDKITITSAGLSWINEGDLDLRIVDETNKLNTLMYVDTDQGFPSTENVFVPSSPYKLRLFADKTWYRQDGFTREVSPWEHKDSDSTFSIPISNGSGSEGISFNIQGTVVNVRIN